MSAVKMALLDIGFDFVTLFLISLSCSPLSETPATKTHQSHFLWYQCGFIITIIALIFNSIFEEAHANYSVAFGEATVTTLCA